MLKINQQVEESSTEQILLTLFNNDHAQTAYSLGMGGFTLKFKNKTFKIQDMCFLFSTYIAKFFQTHADKTELVLDSLLPNIDIGTMESIVKLLWGFKDVLVMHNHSIQLLIVLEKLGKS